MKNKVLIPGLGIANRMGLCCVDNLDYGSLYANPTTFLWADKVCLPSGIFADAVKAPRTKFDIAIATLLEQLHNHDMLELLDDSLIETLGDPAPQIRKAMKRDMRKLYDAFPDAVKCHDYGNNDFRNIEIGKYDYCEPYIMSIYASLSLAEDINAHCLFDNRAYTFLKYKLGLDYKRITKKAVADVYDDIFAFALPNDISFPGYAWGAESKCTECAKEEECAKNMVPDLKKQLKTILEYRSYDELYTLRAEIDSIISSHILDDKSITPELVRNELRSRQQRIKTLLNRRFPEVKRWTKTATLASIPATLVSATTGNVPATIASAALTGLAQGAEQLMEIYESKKKWVSFIKLPD